MKIPWPRFTIFRRSRTKHQTNPEWVNWLTGLLAQSSFGSERINNTTFSDLQANRGWVYAANRQIAGRASRAEPRLNRISLIPEMGMVNPRSDPVLSHPFLDLVRRPNADETGLVFRWRQILQLNTAGTCYVLAVPRVITLTLDDRVNVVSRIETLRLLDPAQTFAESSHGRIAGSYTTSEFGYSKTFRAAPYTPAEIAEWKNDPYPFVFRVIMPSGEGYEGLGPSKASKISRDNLSSLGVMHNNQLRKGLHAGLIFYVLGADDDPERFRKAAILVRQGLGSAGEPMVLNKNRFEVAPSPVTNSDMAFPELAEVARHETLAVHGTNDGLIGLVENVNRSSLWALEFLLATGTIDPLNQLIADAYNTYLLPLYPAQSSSSRFSMQFTSARMVDDRDMMTMLTTAAGGPILSPDEARAELKRPPTPGGDIVRDLESVQDDIPEPESPDSPQDVSIAETDQPRSANGKESRSLRGNANNRVAEFINKETGTRWGM